jgi:carboxypeptidase C (cathepsin A)
MNLRPTVLLAVVLGLATNLSVAADIATPADEASEASPSPAVAIEPPPRFERAQRGRIGGRELRWTARVAAMQLAGADGAPAAEMYYTAYLAETDESGEPRPLTFVFNGGPGSSSMWLHMGLLGPRRVLVDSEARADDGAPPYRVVDNPDSLLAVTDLVFIDPIGTGWSRVIGAGKTADYWSLDGDVASIAQFIRRFVDAEDRWNAPKYLVGQSFGTTRAALLAESLLGDGQSLALNGIVMVSQAMDYTGSTPAPDNVIAHVTYLPTMAATARYHGRAGTDRPLADWVDAARRFAVDEYLPALFRGSTLPAEDRERIAGRLAEFTGLPRDYVLRADLRVSVPRFAKELLRAEGAAVGRMDARFRVDEPDDTAAEPRLEDAAMLSISSAVTAVLNDYLRRELGARIDRPYMTSNGDISDNWNYCIVPEGQTWEPVYVNTARALSDAMRANPAMRVFVANGYYDLITPFFDAEYTLARHEIPRERVLMRYYEAGHMPYLRQGDFEALVRDLRAFYANQL